MSKADRQDAIAVRRIFKRRIARNLWLGIKPGHITSQYFNADIEYFATLIHKWFNLYRVLCCGNDPIFRFGGPDERVKEMCMLLLPYVASKQDLEFIVSPKSA